MLQNYVKWLQGNNSVAWIYFENFDWFFRAFILHGKYIEIGVIEYERMETNVCALK